MAFLLDSEYSGMVELLETIIIVFIETFLFWMFIYGYYRLSGSKNPLKICG
jgi:hypothetical protein